MLEDWVDDAEIEATPPVPIGAGRAPAGEAGDEAGDEAPAVEPDASAAARGVSPRRVPPRSWRGGWFALLAVGLIVVVVDEIPDWVPTELPFGIDGLAGPDRWSEVLTSATGDDARGSPADAASGRLDDQAFSGENVLPRDGWRAAPLLAKTDQLGEPWRITVHHSGGGALTRDDLPGTARLLRAIQKNHQEQRRWVDIAYHYLVDRAGRVWEGRSSRWVGAHAGSSGANQGNLGILVLGNFDEQSLPPAQVRALTLLVESLRHRHEIALESVLTHAEVRETHGMETTKCPGRNLAEWVQTYRQGETARIDSRVRIGD